MRPIVLLTCVLLAAFAADIVAEDLLHVRVNSEREAKVLAGLPVQPIMRVNSGYLVLSDRGGETTFGESGLAITAVANNVDRSELFVDHRLDRLNATRFQLLYEEDNLRLYRIPGGQFRDEAAAMDLVAVGDAVVPVVYHVGASTACVGSCDLVDLDSLIGLVTQSTLYTYDSTLQAFPGRVAGTAGNRAARDWFAGKFAAFGYDSVYIDTFQASLSGTPTQCYNVVATKLGTRYPDHQVIVGAHFDAVSGSPGADDNGSGSSAVLEIARILAGIETDMTFIFILFDAEEYGLYGSEHYAGEAYARGDNIVYMFDLDMVGAINNSNEVTVYHGTDTSYSFIYLDLADSLLNLTGYLSGNIAASDHYPFSQLGYIVTFIIEYNFSPVYHTYQDSTTYMDFSYMTKLVKSALATTYYVSQTEGPVPSLVFGYPDGMPAVLSPGKDTAFPVSITGVYGGSMVPGTALLHWDVDDHGWASAAMAEVTPGLYQATLPPFDCYSRVKMYVSAEEVSQGLVTDPDPSQPHPAVVATQVNAVFEDHFDSQLGWTVSGNATDGQWDRGVPAGGGARGDPPADYDTTGYGMCYLTDNVAGNSDVDNGTTSLISPLINLSGATDAYVNYARWYSNSFGDAPYTDSMMIYISNDGGVFWTLVEVVGPVEQASGGWFEHSFWVADFVSPTAQMKMRFDASDLGSGSVVEAALDAFSVKTYFCEELWLCGDANGNGIGPDIEDLVYLVNYMFAYGPPPPELAAVDMDGSGSGPDIADLLHLVNFMFNQGPDLNCL